jgi:hypothetical protein
MRLASMSQVSTSETNSPDDRPELVQRVEKALQTVRKEFAAGSKESNTSGEIAAAPVGDEQVRLLRRHLNTYLDLMALRALFIGDVQATMRQVNKAASQTLNVQRVSVWFVDTAVSKITCADLFDRSTGQHSSGTELFSKDFPPYFRALKVARTIAAHDAHEDPRTSCFSGPYLKPLGINSMLDVPIYVNKAMVGVICHEHVGPKRTWNADEETFAYLMSNFVSLALERKAP